MLGFFDIGNLIISFDFFISLGAYQGTELYFFLLVLLLEILVREGLRTFYMLVLPFNLLSFKQFNGFGQFGG